jgi:hypothetical protein
MVPMMLQLVPVGWCILKDLNRWPTLALAECQSRALAGCQCPRHARPARWGQGGSLANGRLPWASGSGCPLGDALPLAVESLKCWIHVGVCHEA